MKRFEEYGIIRSNLARLPQRTSLGFIRRRVGTADLAEDILQDVFVKAHSRLDALTDSGRVQGWLYRIARNTIINYHRTHKSSEPMPEEMVARLSEGNIAFALLRPCLRRRLGPAI